MEYRNNEEGTYYTAKEYNKLYKTCEELAADNEKWESDFRNLDEECAKTIAELEAKVKQLTEDKKDLIEGFSAMTNLISKQLNNILTQ